MVVLQFAWGGGTNNVHLPHMHYENSFCYPGTHDNETAVGWFADSANAQDKKYLQAYLGSDGSDIAWDLIKAAMASVSGTSVIMMQVRTPPMKDAVLCCAVLGHYALSDAGASWHCVSLCVLLSVAHAWT